MLKSKWLMLTLSSTLLFTVPTSSGIKSFQSTEQLIENKVDINGMVIHKDNLGLMRPNILVQFEKDKEELNKKKIEEQKHLNQSDNKEWQEFILTFYTSLDCENGFGAITSQGKRLSRGGVANNIIPQNTKIYLDKWGEVTVNDKGSGKHFNVDSRLDVYIEREYGESNRHYSQRVNSYGVQKVKGYIVK